MRTKTAISLTILITLLLGAMGISATVADPPPEVPMLAAQPQATVVGPSPHYPPAEPTPPIEIIRDVRDIGQPGETRSMFVFRNGDIYELQSSVSRQLVTTDKNTKEVVTVNFDAAASRLPPVDVTKPQHPTPAQDQELRRRAGATPEPPTPSP
jgi:hypothetical protein